MVTIRTGRNYPDGLSLSSRLRFAASQSSSFINETTTHSPSTASSSSNNAAAVEETLDGAIIAEAICQCLIVFLSIVGNVLVLLSLAVHHRLRSKKSNVIFVLSLATADFLVAVCVMPFHIIQTIIGYWPFGATFCNIFIANDVFFCTASLLGIMCIAVERYVAVFKPLRYTALMTTRVAILMISLAWVLSLLISYIPIHFQWHVMSEINNETTAYYSNQSEKNDTARLPDCSFAVNPTYAVVSSLISYWVPTSIMIYVYLRMYVAAKKQLSALSRAASLLPKFDSTIYVRTPSTDTKSRRFSIRKLSIISAKPQKVRVPSMIPSSLRTEVTLGRILGCFIVCWTPFFTLLVIDSAVLSEPLDPNQFGWLFKTVLWIGYVNSAANPFIYALSNREFEPLLQRLKVFCSRSNQQSNNSSIKTNSTCSNAHDASVRLKNSSASQGKLNS